MIIDRIELKTDAKKQISGNILTYFGLEIIFGLILSVASFTFLGELILIGPLCLGETLFMLEVVRKGKGQLETGFMGFKQFGTSFVASLLTGIFVFLWSLLFVIPGIIASLKYSMTYYIIADEPELSGYEAMKKSKEMMDGHKSELFVLLLSFFWWYILCSVTFGIAAIYVGPYIKATVTNFYEKIKITDFEQQKLLTE